jgi:exodeoxyribonuclease-1
MAFVFYDTETTGTHLHFDQILQFAAILTTDDLVEVERFEIRSRLLPHVVASPGAMNVTGVTAAQLDDPAYPSHYEMACRIHQKLTAWQPAQFVGHNSIEFDEVLLRSAFYKSLLPVYLTNTNGNSRLDSLKMLRLASMYEPDGIHFPLNENGQPSFKLDQIAPANGFNHTNAHEAMSDVEATIFMCQKLREDAPETWSRFMRFSNKSAVLDFCDSEDVFGLTEFYFGKPYAYLLHSIGANPEDANEIITFDLSYDPDEFAGYSDDDLQIQIVRSPKAVRRFRANALPGLVYGDDAHPNSRARDADFDEIVDRARRLSQNSELRGRLTTAYLASKTAYDLSPNVEENLYADFPSNADKQRMLEFHHAEWSGRYTITCQFEDPRYRELGERIIFADAPDYLPLSRRLYWRQHVAHRLLGAGPTCKALALPGAIQQADDLLANLQGERETLLRTHRDRLVAQLQELQAHSD